MCSKKIFSSKLLLMHFWVRVGGVRVDVGVCVRVTVHACSVCINLYYMCLCVCGVVVVGTGVRRRASEKAKI